MMKDSSAGFRISTRIRDFVVCTLYVHSIGKWYTITRVMLANGYYSFSEADTLRSASQIHLDICSRIQKDYQHYDSQLKQDAN